MKDIYFATKMKRDIRSEYYDFNTILKPKYQINLA
jgi:hypothetical protein